MTRGSLRVTDAESGTAHNIQGLADSGHGVVRRIHFRVRDNYLAEKGVEVTIWREVSRRLNDGVNIRVQPILVSTHNSEQPHEQKEMADWISVNIYSAVGHPMYSGVMRSWEALGEIPYQLDRARDFEREFTSERA